MNVTDAQVEAFQVGDLVEKVGGRYGGPGRVIGITEDMGDGYRLYSVAMKVEGGYGEFVHVFPAAVLRAANPAANPPPADKGEPVATYREPAVVAIGSRYEPVYRYQTPDHRSFSQSYPDEGRPPIRPDAPQHLECLTSAELIASRDAIRREAFEEAAKALAVIERMANTIQFNGNQRDISHEDHMRAWKDVEATAIRARAET